jgi:hypothetical protein
MCKHGWRYFGTALGMRVMDGHSPRRKAEDGQGASGVVRGDQQAQVGAHRHAHPGATAHRRHVALGGLQTSLAGLGGASLCMQEKHTQTRRQRTHKEQDKGSVMQV